MAFTKQHYEAIAEIVRERRDSIFRGNRDISDLAILSGHLVNYFAKDNPCFNRDKFIKACGL